MLWHILIFCKRNLCIATDNPKDEDYHYEWVTINTYNELLEAKIEYRIRMSELNYKKQKEEESKKSAEEFKKQQELENTIVEIIDVDVK